jgi:hypothetical protein
LGKLIVRLAGVDGWASCLLACVQIRRVKLLSAANRLVYCFVCCCEYESYIKTLRFRGSMEFCEQLKIILSIQWRPVQ